jgi:hypothetical protein
MRNRTNTILSLLALFAALCGTAYAAVTVTGKDVKNGSLTGRDVRDASIGVADLNRSARTQSAPAQGPAGPEGPAGPAGPAGEPGLPSVAAARRYSRDQAIGRNGAVAAVAILSVPAGSWVVNATGVLANFTPNSQSARCTLEAHIGGGSTQLELGETGSLSVFSSPGKLPIALGSAIETDAETEFIVFCGSAAGGAMVAQQMSITATRVESVDDRTRPTD